MNCHKPRITCVIFSATKLFVNFAKIQNIIYKTEFEYIFWKENLLICVELLPNNNFRIIEVSVAELNRTYSIS